MQKVSKLVVLICSLLSFSLSGQHANKITNEQQVSFTQFLAVGNPSLFLESIVIEITLADILQFNQEKADTLLAAYTDSNSRANSFINLQEKKCCASII